MVSNVGAGGTFSFNVGFYCGTPGNTAQGDIGTSALTITTALPSNFTYTGYTLGPAGLPGTVSYNASTKTLTYSDPGGTTCQSGQYFNGYNGGNEVIIAVNGTASTAGSPNAAGTQICNTASASFTYIDGLAASSTSPTVCTTVVAPVPTNFLRKNGSATTYPNVGQFSFGGSTVRYPYTYPGNWDRTGTSAGFQLLLRANGKNAGATFAITDPLPCLDNYTGSVYSSAPAGTTCQNPAFIPTVVAPPNGFTATASDRLTLIYTDGTTATVPYVAGTGWTIPTSPRVAEIDFPQMPGQAQNTTDANNDMWFQMWGYAAAAAVPGSLLTNTATSTAYLASSGAAVAGPISRSNSVLVLDSASTSNTILRPNIGSTYSGQCVENLNWSTYGSTLNAIEVPNAPSKAIFFDYLAPKDGALSSSTTQQFTIQQVRNGGAYNLQQSNIAGVAPIVTAGITATVTANYQGTGRTLYSWAIPAGTITAAGNYTLAPPNLNVKLVNGCAGTYQNDLTIGYGTTIDACYYGGLSQSNYQAAPGANYSSSSQLTSNSAGTQNWCGNSAPLTVAAINPGFSITKTAQGNLDAAPQTPTAHVSPSGGTAAYALGFVNTGASSLNNPVLYDLLPRVGDTAVSSTAARGSQFAAQLASVGPLPANTVLSYSTAANPCRPEVLPTNAGCVNDWSVTPPANLATTTALKIVYNGTLYVNGAGTSSFSVPVSVTTPAVAAGQVAYNSVAATATAGTALLAPAESTPVGLQAQAGLTISKSSAITSVAAAGDSIPVTFSVTNGTAVTVSNVRVTDTLTDAGAGATPPAATCVALSAPAGSCSGATTTLLAGQTARFSAVYTVTQADIDHGRIADTGTVVGAPPTGGGLTATSNEIAVTAAASPSMTMTKTSSSVVTRAGDPIVYSFVVTNTGNVTLSSIAIVERAFTGSGAVPAVTCPAGSLAPRAGVTCTATYITTQADVDAGQVSNTAAGSAVAPAGTAVVSADSRAVTVIAPVPALRTVKSASPVGQASYTLGQTVTFSVVVTNTGNVTLTNVVPQDTSFTGSGTLPPLTPASAASLAPGASATFTTTYTLTQADIDRGTTRNTASATATAPGGSGVTSGSSTVQLPSLPQPALLLVKSVSSAPASLAGDTVTYDFRITNTGNVTLSAVTAVEQSFSGSGSVTAVVCPAAAQSVLPGAAVTCTASYVLSQADVDAGQVVNTATASASVPAGGGVTSPASTATATVVPAAALTVTKTADTAVIDRAGQSVTYSFAVVNTGNVTLSGVTITEQSFSGTGSVSAVTCPTGSLSPRGTVTCTADYTVTQADVDSGSLQNTATASATAPGGATIAASASSTVTTPVLASPLLTLVKSADVVDRADYTLGRTVTYAFVVTNSGNVTVSNVAIQEQSFSGSGMLGAAVCPVGVALAPSAQLTCTATYTVTQADIDTGELTNSAMATGQTPTAFGSAVVLSPTSTAVVPGNSQPAVTVVKTSDTARITSVGQKVGFVFTVTNTGNVTLTDAQIVDSGFTGAGTLSAISCPAAATRLLPGAVVTCSATYEVVGADAAAAAVRNTATVSATTPSGAITDPSIASTVIVPVAIPSATTNASALAVTGAAPALIPLAVAGVLLLSGVVVLLIRRRRRRDEV